ncbi:siderophore ABC transporter substrate-binding protein EitA [Siccibacter colletis]|uniref:ABC transporter substrate-binding protein n=1 Tax=Siccibacter colletis TaxID=1505757 RepID=A0ABY6JGC7_9ENTR|nr:ABC transporter substrate-binding protein [Siccibacter colletis]UYU32891.1 ABC transporter substrate-binding protein [Siccibacter colletis]
MVNVKQALWGLGLLSLSGMAGATQYPLTLENCGTKVVFEKSPQRMVALGQNTAEIMLLLGLQDKMVASAFWPTKVLPELAGKNEKVPVLTVEIPTLESILARQPDFVAAQLPLLLGPDSKVAKREDFAAVGINSYLSPGVCATKKNTGDIYGSRSQLWDMTLLYKEIEDLATIFDVEDRGAALVNDFRQRENALRTTFGHSKRDLSFVFWFSSASPSSDAYLGGKNSASGFIASVLGGHNAISSDSEWPTVGWESIIATNPDVIVVSSLDRNRWALDSAEEKIKFLKSDPAVSQLEAVKKGHIVVMDGQAMNPTIRTIYGAEQVAAQLEKLGLN